MKNNPLMDIATVFGEIVKEMEKEYGNGNKGMSVKANMKEKSNSYELEVEVPGISKEDISIDIEGSSIIISGERKTLKKEEDEKHVKIESSYGSFKRTFTMPEDTDKNAISAKNENGILYVSIPKKEKETKKVVID